MLLSISVVLIYVFRNLFLGFKLLSATSKFHKQVIYKLFNAPINLFYDRTPLGRVLNRLSGDLTSMDTDIAGHVDSVIEKFIEVVSNIILAVVFTRWWVVIFIIIFAYGSSKIYKRYVTVIREILRLERISNSPILSSYTEVMSGLSVIRTLKKEKKFLEK